MKVNIFVVIAIVAVISIVLIFGSQIIGIFSGEVKPTTIGNFLVDQSSVVCKELDRPIVYIFGSTTCPHCIWEDPVIRNVTSKFLGTISFHENIDVTTERDVFNKYSPDGYIPLVLIGCKYYRVGSGESLGVEQETRILTALICSLTDKQPSAVCSGVEDLISQIG